MDARYELGTQGKHFLDECKRLSGEKIEMNLRTFAVRTRFGFFTR